VWDVLALPVCYSFTTGALLTVWGAALCVVWVFGLCVVLWLLCVG